MCLGNSALKPQWLRATFFCLTSSLMVALMDKDFQCLNRLIFKSIWCYSSHYKHTESTTSQG